MAQIDTRLVCFDTGGVVGESADLVAILKDISYNFLPGKRIDFNVEGYVYIRYTDVRSVATLPAVATAGLPEGTYIISVSFGGDAEYNGSTCALTLVISSPCTCTAWINAECTTVGKRRQTRTCTPAGCMFEERTIDDATCKSTGDITKVELDGKLLPEGGTLDWLLNDEAFVRVFFKNTGNLASIFNIVVTYNGASVFTGATGTIPANSAECVIDCGSFVPNIAGIHTVAVTINP